MKCWERSCAYRQRPKCSAKKLPNKPLIAIDTVHLLEADPSKTRVRSMNLIRSPFIIQSDLRESKVINRETLVSHRRVELWDDTALCRRVQLRRLASIPR